ncbi:unnamed protein product [Rhizophagus irregularis]|nr:unnamed protein product [Rhizophagus irregularis]
MNNNGLRELRLECLNVKKAWKSIIIVLKEQARTLTCVTLSEREDVKLHHLEDYREDPNRRDQASASELAEKKIMGKVEGIMY